MSSLQTTPRSERSHNRSMALAAAAVILSVAILPVLGIYFGRIWIAEHLIVSALRAQGLDDVTLSISTIDTHTLIIEDLHAGAGALEVARIAASFQPTRLLDLEIDAIEVEHARAALRWDDRGVYLGELPLDFQPSEGPTATPKIGRLAARDLRLTVMTPSATITAPADISAERSENGWRVNATGAVEGPGVNVAVTWAGFFSSQNLAQSSGSGSFDLNIHNLDLPGIGSGLNAGGRTTVTAQNGVFAMNIEQPIVFAFTALDPTFTNKSSLLQDLRDVPVTFVARPSTQTAALTATEANGRHHIATDLAINVRAGTGNAKIALRGNASSEAGVLKDVNIETLRADYSNIPLSMGKVTGYVGVSGVSGSKDAVTGRLNIAAQTQRLTTANLSAEKARASFEAGFQTQGRHLVINLGKFEIGAAEASSNGWHLSAPAFLTLRQGAVPANELHVEAESGRSMALSFSGAFALPEISARSEDQADAQSITLRLPDIQMSGRVGPRENDLKVSLAGWSVEHALADLRSGIFDAHLKDGLFSATAEMTVWRLGPVGETPDAAHAGQLSATLKSQRDRIAVDGHVGTHRGTVLAEISARAVPDLSLGQAAITIPRTTLPSGTLNTEDIAFLSGPFAFTGVVEAVNDTSWSPQGWTSSARVDLDDANFEYDDIEVSGVSAKLDFPSLSPLQSAGLQRVNVKTIAAGLPITDLSADIGLPGDGTLKIAKVSGGVAGGRISTDDASFLLEGHNNAFALNIQRIDMEQLASLAKVDGLSVTGTLSGTIPLRQQEEGFHFQDGRLQSDAAGRVTYKPSSSPAALSQSQGGNLLLQALSNFAYDRVSISVNGPVLDEINLGVGLSGKNPDLYSGHPIEFNLNLTGRVAEILSQSMTTSRLPTLIDQQTKKNTPSKP